MIELHRILHPARRQRAQRSSVDHRTGTGQESRNAGGSYEKLLNGDIKDLGSDIGAMLAVFK
jgi:hypothetical protein